MNRLSKWIAVDDVLLLETRAATDRRALFSVSIPSEGEPLSWKLGFFYFLLILAFKLVTRLTGMFGFCFPPPRNKERKHVISGWLGSPVVVL